MDYSFLQQGTTAMIIDEQGRDHLIDLMSVDYYIAENKCTVKVEGLESYFKKYSPCTVHCYIAPAGAASFNEHTDPVDVKIVCIDGIKTMEVSGEEVVIPAGDSITIPAYTPHRATNRHSSTMLSVGYE